MGRELGRLGRCAAALQCIAEEFREFAEIGSKARDDDLHRFAGLLDHMAATLMVPPASPSAQVLTLPPPSRRRLSNRAASHQ